MSNLLLPLIIAGALAAGVFMLLSNFSDKPKKTNLLEERLRQFAVDPGNASIDDIELAVPFSERILAPFMGKLSGAVTKYTKGKQLREVQKQLAAAGYPWGMKPEGFLVFKVVMLFVGLGFGYFLVSFLNADSLVKEIAFLLAGVAGGYYFPSFLIKDKAKKRTKTLQRALPGALDILTISMDAGLSFEAALTRMVGKRDDILAIEFEFVLSDLRLGRPRGEALMAMAEKVKVEELTKFIQQVVQSEQLGVGLTQIMRIHSDELRRLRRQRAEEAGARAPLKMMIPMVGCIFPTIFLILLGPAVIQVVANFTK